MKKKKSFFGAVNLTALVLAALLPMGLLTGLLTGCKPKVDPKYNYTVEHLQQNIGDDEYTVYEREILSGKAGETTSAAAKPYEGFTVQDFSQAAINADGSTVVQIKYNRNEITLTFNLNGGTTTTDLIDDNKLKGKFGSKIKLEDLKKGSEILRKWEPELPSTFPAQNTTYEASWTDKYHITIKGDERTDIADDTEFKVELNTGKTWANIKAQVEAKVNLKHEWQGGDYEVYEWRLGDETGEKLKDEEPINKHFTVYAVTNYAKAQFNIVGDKIIVTNGKGYKGAAPKGKIIIPDGITEIEEGDYDYGAFFKCTEISSAVLPESLKTIGSHAFYGCTGLTSINLSYCPNLTTIVGGTFKGCTGLTSIDLSYCPNLTTIGSGTFEGCTGLTSINLPASLTTIGHYAFLGCTGLTSINLPASLTTIEYTTFYGCTGLTSINLPEGLTEIGISAFSGCAGLTSINLPTSLTTIESSAFSGCTGLTSINLPASLTTIASTAFSSCTNLRTLTVAPGNQQYKAVDNVLYTKDGLTLVCAARGLTSVKILRTVTAIHESAFSGCKGLTSINLPVSLTTIGRNAFEGCTGLENVYLFFCKKLTEISSGSFWGCTGLTSIDLSYCTNLTTIGGGAFRDCTGLTSINLPASLTTIGGNAFLRCTKLTSTTFANPVGWAVYDSWDYSGTPTPINEEKLKAPKTAASFLSSEYYKKYWKKN